jgi:uncharacterized protein YndB with AHSA1/START domain
MAEGGVTREETGPERVVVSGPFLTMEPRTMYRAWTEAWLLTRWWPPVAELEVREGGRYHLAWPSMDWHLRGRYLAVEPEQLLRFTWKWDHDTLPERVVEVRMEPLPQGGTRLRVEHGTYSDSPEDVEDRESHASGWLHFLGQLYMKSPELAREPGS